MNTVERITRRATSGDESAAIPRTRGISVKSFGRRNKGTEFLAVRPSSQWTLVGEGDWSLDCSASAFREAKSV